MNRGSRPDTQKEAELSALYKKISCTGRMDYLIKSDQGSISDFILNQTTKNEIQETYFKINNLLTGGFQTGADILNEYENEIHVFSSGITQLDDLIIGGLHSNFVLEILGGPSSGKTNICYQFAYKTISETIDRVLYIDSGDSFIYELFARKFPAIKQAELKKLTVFKADSPRRLILSLLALMEELDKNKMGDSQIKLIIIDNFSTIMQPKNEFSEYLSQMQEIHRLFKILNNIYYVGILVLEKESVTTSMKSNYGRGGKEKEIRRAKSILPSPWKFYFNLSVCVERSLIYSEKKKTILTKFVLNNGGSNVKKINDEFALLYIITKECGKSTYLSEEWDAQAARVDQGSLK